MKLKSLLFFCFLMLCFPSTLFARSEYIIPDSNARYLTTTELSDMTPQIMRYAKNEIYARHGRIFTSKELAGYFSQQSWYKGIILPNNFNESVFNNFEKNNITLLQNLEGGRYTVDQPGYSYTPIYNYIKLKGNNSGSTISPTTPISLNGQFSKGTNGYKAQLLDAKKTYKINLNGGKEELVRYENSNISGDLHARIYVNDKIVWEKIYAKQGNSGDNYVRVYLVDMNKSDKYKELIVSKMVVNSYATNTYIVRYKSQKKTMEYALKNASGTVMGLRYSGLEFDQKNNVIFRQDTPFRDYKFGCYYVYRTAKFKSGKFYFPNQKNYDVDSSTPLVNGDKYYKLSRSVKLFEKSKLTSKYSTLPAGTQFRAIIYRPGTTEQSYESFIKIKTVSGKKGWIHSSNSESEFLVYKPLWG